MADFFSEYGLMLLTETGATLAMALISTLIAYIVGIPLGVLGRLPAIIRFFPAVR